MPMVLYRSEGELYVLPVTRDELAFLRWKWKKDAALYRRTKPKNKKPSP